MNKTSAEAASIHAVAPASIGITVPPSDRSPHTDVGIPSATSLLGREPIGWMFRTCYAGVNFRLQGAPGQDAVTLRESETAPFAPSQAGECVEVVQGLA